jgi:hypothetical protein
MLYKFRLKVGIPILHLEDATPMKQNRIPNVRPKKNPIKLPDFQISIKRIKYQWLLHKPWL